MIIHFVRTQNVPKNYYFLTPDQEVRSVSFLEDFPIVLNEWSTSQKMKFSIKDFSSKCDQIRRKLILFE